MVIYKYELNRADTFQIQIPAGAKPIHIACQGNSIMMWAEVDPNAQMVRKMFHCVGTGQEPPKGASYLGTVMDGVFVWHYYWYANSGW